jgi:hypothetical protein
VRLRDVLPGGSLAVMSKPLATEPVLRLDECVYRTARKTWVCKCDCHRLPNLHDPEGEYAKHSEFCLGTINPGDRYIEYMGEVGGYGESGTRYCLPCGAAVWGAETDSPCTYCNGTGRKGPAIASYDCPDCCGTGEKDGCEKKYG